MKQNFPQHRTFNRLGPRARYGGLCCASLFAAQQALAQSAPLAQIPDVSVTSLPIGKPAEGSEAAGYKPETVSNLGPLGQLPLLDTPYSVNVISAPLIENLQISRPDDIFRISPTTQIGTTTGRGFSPNAYVRGFLIPNSSGRGEDGMVLQNLFPISLEDKERVEVFTGLTSFLYGPTSVGGFINYVYKRPTDVPLASITVGDYGGLSGYVHGDVGGPLKIPNLADGLFSFRLNIVGQDGDTAISNQSEKRDLLTAALTWHVAENASITVIGSHTDQNIQGADAAWSIPTNANGSPKFAFPAPPNPSQNWGQPWTAYQAQRDRIGADGTWKLNEIFTLRTSYAYSQVTERDNIFANNAFTSAAGNYSQSLLHNTNFHYYANTGYALLDANFDTWFVHNKVTAGFYGNDLRTKEAPTSYAAVANSNLSDVVPSYIAQPNFVASGIGPVRTINYNNAKNFIVGDEIKFTDQWSALVGGNYTELSGQTYNIANSANGLLTSAYDQGRLTPSTSLIFKPLPWISTYATYSQSLQPGQVVANSGPTVYTNNGSILPPFVGTEYEVGAKADIGGILLTGALFQIQQALQYANYNNNGTYTYVQSGTQRNRGVELTATGTVFPGLRILAGLTLIDPREFQGQTSATAPAVNGLIAPGVAGQLEKITAEYDLPFLKGLTLTGGFYFTGQQAIDRLDTYWLPAFATEDLGFRYRTSDILGQKLPVGQEFVLRFDVTNITNKAYWLTPNGYLGAPRTFAASAQLHF